VSSLFKGTPFLLFLLFFVPHSGECQNEDSEISIKEAFAKIEENSNYRFYYKSEWVDSLVISKELLHPPYDIALVNRLIEGTPLNFILKDSALIFLNNMTILTEFPIYKNEVEESVIEFKSSGEVVPEEDRLITIGSINQYNPNTLVKVNGYILNGSNDQPLDGVYIYSEDQSSFATTDQNGFFELELLSGNQTLFFQAVGMDNTRRNLMVYSEGSLNLTMDIDVVALETVEVVAQRDINIKNTGTGLVNLSPRELKVVPALLGEKDIIKLSTLTAGVQTVGEGAIGLNIRGGKADQNLFLLDGSTVFNTNHFFGFFGIFNGDAISDLSLYKSGMPTSFGGRLSSVFDIKSKEPSSDKLSVKGGIGPVTSKLLVETPILDHTSVLLGARATYSDFVLNQIRNSPIANNNVSFYDLVLKTHTRINEKNELSLTGYFSKDAFQLASDSLLSFSDFDYTNSLVSLRWKHIFNNSFIAKVHAGISDYSYGTSYDVIPSQGFDMSFFIRERKLSLDFDQYKNERLSFNYGIEYKGFEGNPGTRSPLGAESLVSAQNIPNEQGFELAPYFSTTYEYSDRISLVGGIRFSNYNVLGPLTVNEYLAGEPLSPSSVTGSQDYKKGEIIQSYNGLEPRLGVRIQTGLQSSIKASYDRTRQNTHLLINAASISPTDVWRLSSPFIKPQIADQFSVGYYKNFESNGVIETSIEAYYKDITNLLDFKTGSELQFNNTIETDILQGDGRSYGVELSLKKSQGWLNGWINYTYSRSLVRLDGQFPSERVNGGEFFPTGYDKPHYVNSVVNYKFNSRITITTNMIFSSGIPATYPVAKWDFRNSENLVYSDRNSFRVPNYFRCDLSFNIDASHKVKKLASSSWTFSVFNVLGRDNVYSVFFDVEDGQVNGYELLVFKDPIPTITYNFRF